MENIDQPYRQGRLGLSRNVARCNVSMSCGWTRCLVDCTVVASNGIILEYFWIYSIRTELHFLFVVDELRDRTLTAVILSLDRQIFVYVFLLSVMFLYCIFLYMFSILCTTNYHSLSWYG